jgi:pimeloyl-ACP methyl ester carboxylesterase
MSAPSETSAETTERQPCPAPASLVKALAEYNAEARVIDVPTRFYRTRCRILGQGPTVVVSPGLASTYEGFALFLKTLANDYQTIIYDYPGDQPGDAARLSRISHDDLVTNLFDLLDHLNVGRAFLVGISFGSTVTLKALARDPRRFPKAGLQGGFARRKFSVPEKLALKLGRLFPGTTGALPLHETILTYNNRLHFPDVIDDRWQHYLEQNARTPIRSLAHRLDLISRLDLRPILSTIQTPVLLAQGNEDRIVPRACFEELQKTLPTAQGAILPMVGHQPHYTHPEALAQLFSSFFTGCEEHAECASHNHNELH